MATYVTIPILSLGPLNARAPAMSDGTTKRIIFHAGSDFVATDTIAADPYLESWVHFGRYLATKRAMDIACFGDSLTNGSGATSGKNYPSLLDRDYYGYERAVFNGGYDGGTSTVIKGVFDSNPNQHPAVRVIWAGNNNPRADQEATARDDVAYMLATDGHPRYLVLGNICGKWGTDYEQGGAIWNNIASRNSYWSDLHGDKFLDVFALLRANGNGGAQDNADIAKGQVPTSLCSDEIHLNDAGYAIVANAVYAKIIALGY